MSHPPSPPSRFSRHLAGSLVLLAGWTVALLAPRPVPEAVSKGLSLDAYFVLSKGLHAGAYAALAVTAATLPGPRRRAAVALGVVAAHAVATEAGQALMDIGRHGCVQDVLINWGGALAGLLALRWYRTRFGARAG